MGCCNKPTAPLVWLPHFAGFTDYSPTLPTLYYNVDSIEQRTKALCMELHKLVCYADMLGIKINENHGSIEALANEFDEFKASGFLDYYEQQLEAWIAENMPDIIAKAIKMVFFGLTLDGYFVAYIPESWSDIVFDTGAVYGSEEYGRLILLMNVDNASPVEPDIGEYHSDFAILNNHVQQLDLDVNALTETVEGFEPTVNDLEQRVSRNETTLYTPITQNEVVDNG